MNFEDNLARLESLVGKMQSGGMKLEEMITSYEVGCKLADECAKDLDSIRQRIEVVRNSVPTAVKAEDLK